MAIIKIKNEELIQELNSIMDTNNDSKSYALPVEFKMSSVKIGITVAILICITLVMAVVYFFIDRSAESLFLLAAMLFVDIISSVVFERKIIVTEDKIIDQSSFLGTREYYFSDIKEFRYDNINLNGLQRGLVIFFKKELMPRGIYLYFMRQQDIELLKNILRDKIGRPLTANVSSINWQSRGRKEKLYFVLTIGSIVVTALVFIFILYSFFII